MDKFIDRQRLEAHFSPAITGKDAYTAGEVLLSIQMFPSADVAPVIHAHWVRMYNNDWLCSNCDNILDESTDLNDIRYCSWCGAKMDEKVS